MPSTDPVSWLLIEKGWTVLSADGREVGRVSEVTGDDREDIFDGLAFRPHSMRKARYVPAEQVGSITQGAVMLSLSAAEVDRLGGWMRGQRR